MLGVKFFGAEIKNVFETGDVGVGGDWVVVRCGGSYERLLG